MTETRAAGPLPRLLRTPAPFPGESFPGFLLRLAVENSYDSIVWIPQRAGLKINPSLGEWKDLWRPGPALAGLRDLSGLSEEELRGLQAERLPDCLMRWQAPKVCPACLREEAWCRKVWDRLPETDCRRHRVVLIDRCPECRRRIGWARKSVSVCRCGYDWRGVSLPVIDAPLLPAGVDPGMAAALMDAWLLTKRGLRLQPTMPNAECHDAVVAVAAALDDWPEGFRRLLDEWDTADLTKLQAAWCRHYGGELSETAGGLPVAVALNEYLSIRMPGRQTIDYPQRFVMREAAGRHLGLTPAQIEQLVKQGRLRGADGVFRTGISWIGIRSLGRLRQEIDSLLTEVTAADALGISRRQLRDLVSCGWIEPDGNFGMDRRSELKFARRTLRVFVDRLSRQAAPAEEMEDEVRIVSFVLVAVHLELHELRLSEFVQAIERGFPRPFIFPETAMGGLSRFRFRTSDIDQYLNPHPDLTSRPSPALHNESQVKRIAAWLDQRQTELENRFFRSESPISHITPHPSRGGNVYTNQLKMILQSLRSSR